ncbi:MAG: hypothetical protein PHE24_04815 [Patescibacteria group bacterium]|nr:hypothetical protein [Patescibacteria group bacterium]
MKGDFFLTTIAGLIFISGLIPYGIAICRRQSDPRKISWLIWSILDSVIFAGMINQGTVNAQIAAAFLGNWIIFFLVLKFGYPGWKRMDMFCLGSAGVGIILWMIFRDSNFGISTCLAANLIGSYPTFASAWKNPQSENGLGWMIMWVGCLIQIAAVKHWTFAEAAQPLVFLSVQSTMMYILFVRPLFKKRVVR